MNVRHMLDEDRTMHNMLADALGSGITGTRYLRVTMCGLEAFETWTPAHGPTTCERCTLLAAWEVRARA